MKKLLIYRLGSLGDTVVALPAFHLVARTFPNAERLMLTNFPVQTKAPAASAILEGTGLVHSYITYPVGTRSARVFARLWWQIRCFRPTVLVYMAKSRGDLAVRRDARFFHMCGIRQIIGLPFGELAEPQYDPASGLWEHEAVRILRCIRTLGHADVHDVRSWDLRLNDAEQQKAREVLAKAGGKPLIACGPGTKMQAKDWGRENWAALLAKFSSEVPGHALVMVGAEEETEISNYAATGWQGTVLNLCGKLTPRQTAAVLRHAELFLGPDSGPMHVAAAYQVPCAIAFASRDYRGSWFPVGSGHRVIYHTLECSNCNLEVCIEKKKKCLTSITVDEMLAAAMDAWNNGRKKRLLHPV